MRRLDRGARNIAADALNKNWKRPLYLYSPLGHLVRRRFLVLIRRVTPAVRGAL